jgi:hypothetical protein
MSHDETAITRFFDLYARETRLFDVPAIVAHFADPFLSADPHGTQIVRVSEFAAALPKRKALFERLGSQPATLESIHETPLDSRYVLARTTWRMSFTRENASAQELLVDSTFLMDKGKEQINEAEFKILMYLTHQDLMQILRDRGILQI